MKYLAHTAQDVYTIYRNAVNSVFPKAKLPKSLKKGSYFAINVTSEKSGTLKFERVRFMILETDENCALIMYDNDKLPVAKPVSSVEVLFKRLQNMKNYDEHDIQIYESHSI